MRHRLCSELNGISSIRPGMAVGPVAAVPLSLEPAHVSCRMLQKGALDVKARLIPHGHSYPIATTRPRGAVRFSKALPAANQLF